MIRISIQGDGSFPIVLESTPAQLGRLSREATFLLDLVPQSGSLFVQHNGFVVGETDAETASTFRQWLKRNGLWGRTVECVGRLRTAANGVRGTVLAIDLPAREMAAELLRGLSQHRRHDRHRPGHRPDSTPHQKSERSGGASPLGWIVVLFFVTLFTAVIGSYVGVHYHASEVDKKRNELQVIEIK